MNRDATSSQAHPALPDDASLFHVHEPMAQTRVRVSTIERGFRLGHPTDPFAIEVHWADLVGFAAFPVWPRFRVAYRHIGGITCREYRAFAPRYRENIAHSAKTLFDHINAFRRLRSFEGWLAEPEVRWSGTEAWPGETGHRPSGYRSNARKDKLICAVGDESTSFDRLFLYLKHGRAGSEARLGEYALSETHLYRRHQGSITSVSRSTLRMRRRPVEAEYNTRQLIFSGDAQPWIEGSDSSLRRPHSATKISNDLAVYTFGRNLDVYLFEPDNNPVAFELDKQLLASGDAAVSNDEGQ